RNPAYASAVEQVLSVLRGQSVGEPPPLDEIHGQPEAVRALLFRETQSPTLEALSLVWETAGHLFRRDPGAYGVTGLERVQPLARSVLRALGFAFGQSRPDASGIGPALNLAEMLWQSIPARPQRRLRELCHDVDALDYDQAMVQARIAIRRAGLFAVGHFGVA